MRKVLRVDTEVSALRFRSKDELFVFHDGRTDNHDMSAVCEVTQYTVWNATRQHAYVVFVWQNPKTGAYMADCGCDAHVLCKHMKTAVRHYLEAQNYRLHKQGLKPLNFKRTKVSEDFQPDCEG